ncbi:MAG TPA: nitroreductase family protein [Candidatus Limenecus avicola]|uniref:Nitroreductase family protein n=1 Tax=Candidatus Limenecus avicola TaxID=2840847 RepID=A0A9D1SQN2_9CLOT|nr:nitroreductase family protein [Candidatus Limenecus avicola]
MDIYEAIEKRRTVRDFEDKSIDPKIIKKILSAGLKAPTNNHLREWEFVIVNDKKERSRVLNLEDMTSYDDCEKMMDGFGMTDSDQRGMYHIAMPKQFSMLYNSACLILPFFKLREPLMQPTCLSSLNEFASIWCCIENILLAAAAEGILGVTRIPMTEELEHIKKTINHPDNYTMPCYIALGYPSKDAKLPIQKVINVEDRIHINNW